MKHKARGLTVVMTQAHHGTLCNTTALAVKSRKCDCDCDTMKPGHQILYGAKQTIRTYEQIGNYIHYKAQALISH